MTNKTNEAGGGVKRFYMSGRYCFDREEPEQGREALADHEMCRMLNQSAAALAEAKAKVQSVSEERDHELFEKRDALAALDRQMKRAEAAEARVEELERERDELAWRLDFYKKATAYLRESTDSEHEARRRSLGYADEALDLVEERTKERDEALAKLARADKLAEAAGGYFSACRELAQQPIGASTVPAVRAKNELREALAAYEDSRPDALRVCFPATPVAADHGDVTVPQGSHPVEAAESEPHPDTVRLRSALRKIEWGQSTRSGPACLFCGGQRSPSADSNEPTGHREGGEWVSLVDAAREAEGQDG